MKIKLGITNQIYNLNEPEERQWLEEDLDFTGFFLLEDNWKFKGYFERPAINRHELIDLLGAIYLFQKAKERSPLKALMPKN